MKTKILTLLIVGFATVAWAEDAPKTMKIYQDCDKNGNMRTATGGTEQGHEYVDLGLPSGTMWATMNIGAEYPQNNGSYFQWADPNSKTTGFNWYSYRHCKSNIDEAQNITKYCPEDDIEEKGYCVNGTSRYQDTSDDLTVVTPEDDAATQIWGGAWRMPTKEEMQELFDNCDYEVIGQSGKFTSKKYPDRSIFFPKAGYYYNGNSFMNLYGYYWTATLGQCISQAWYGIINDTKPSIKDGSNPGFSAYNNRSYGLPIRPVLKY